MKDFLYLDSDTISSISAELFEGNTLELLFSSGSINDESISDTLNNTTSQSVSAGIKVPLAKLDGSDTSSESDGKVFRWSDSKTKSKSIKKAYDDYLYTKVIQELDENNEIKNSDECNQFDFVRIEGEFQAVDIVTTSNIFDTDILTKLAFFDTDTFTFPKVETLESIEKKIKNHIANPGKNPLPKDYNNPESAEDFMNTYTGTKVFKTMNEITLHLKKFLGDHIIFSKGNKIIIGKRDYTRVPPELLTLTDSINLNGVGRMITSAKQSKKVREYTNFENINLGSESLMSAGAQGVLLLFLSLLLGLDENDTFEIIQPIGLEFSKVST